MHPAWQCALAAAFLAVAGTASGGPLAPPAPPAGFVERPATAETLAALRRGGHVLYLRHGLTDNTRADRTPLTDPADCAAQRPLSPAGRRQMTAVGNAMRRAGIPLAELHASPLCRTRESAALAFPGLAARLDPGLMYVANLTRAQKAPILARTRALLAAPVAPGGNRLILAHAPNLAELIDYFPREGTLVVFEPRPPGGFVYLASIAPEHWPELPP